MAEEEFEHIAAPDEFGDDFAADAAAVGAVPIDAFAESAEETPGQPSDWSRIWQLPVLLAGLVLLVAGLTLAVARRPSDDFTSVLDAAAICLHQENPDGADQSLARLTPRLDELTNQEHARYALLQADAVYVRQGLDGLYLEDRWIRIISGYGDAAQRGYTFDGEHLDRWARTLVRMDEYEDAMAKLSLMSGEDIALRYPVVRFMVDRELARPVVDQTKVMKLLVAFDREVRRPETGLAAADLNRQLLWAVGVEAKTLLAMNDPERVIDYLLPRITDFALAGVGPELAPLRVTIGRGYQAAGQYSKAREAYTLANKELDPEDPLRGDILVGFGQLLMAQSEDVQTALSYFERADKVFPGSELHLAAVVGRADCQARLGRHGQAREHFQRALKMITGEPVRRVADVDLLEEAVLAHYKVAFEQEDYRLALDYLRLIEPLHGSDLPADLLLMLAMTCERIGEQRQAGGDAAQWRDPGYDPDARDALANSPLFQGIAAAFEASADYYLARARALTIANDRAHADSLWEAAINYDRAQLPTQAIDTLREFRDGHPTDSRYLSARLRLGLAYMAGRRYKEARAEFTQLIDDHGKSRQAYDALVPLARSYVAMDQLDDAERVLLSVVSGHPGITPEATQFHDAIIELGKLYYRQGKHESAISWLDRAVQRYGNGDDAALLHYRLADAYRRSVPGIDISLQEPLTQARRQELLDIREDRLKRAGSLFGDAIVLFGTRSEKVLTPLERACRRNAYFYRADCAFDLGDYKAAIPLYDVAAKQYEKEPASLIALIQIVNAYCELGDRQSAKTANAKAKWRFDNIPVSAFDDPTLPISREHWGDWLRWSNDLQLLDATTASATP